MKVNNCFCKTKKLHAQKQKSPEAWGGGGGVCNKKCKGKKQKAPRKTLDSMKQWVPICGIFA